MSATQPIMLVITPETVLDLYLEYGMPQDLYDHLSEAMDAQAKAALAGLTIAVLNELNGMLPLNEALALIIIAVLNELNGNAPLKEALALLAIAVLNKLNVKD